MKKIISAIVSIMMLAQLFAVMPIAVSADGIGEAYTEPESVTQTFNMNLDWKYTETPTAGFNHPVREAWESAAKGGKQFYEVDYDDSSWETVSIPHAIDGGTNSFTGVISDAGGGVARGVYLYRKTFTVPQSAAGGKVFFELEGIRQAAYVWINGEPLGYYEAGITAMGFDLTNYVTAGQTAVIAICNDGTTARGTSYRIPYETVPGQPWGSSYTPDNYKNTVGGGTQFQWNTKDFNEPQVGLVYDAYLHVKPNVYQTLPLYNNLKTTGNYIYATDFDIRSAKATINVKAEIRNESEVAGSYSLEVAVVDPDGNLAYDFESDAVEIAAAEDMGVVYETAVESDVYDEENVTTPTGITNVNTPDVTYIEASCAATGLTFWSLENPYLYTVYTILKDSSGNVVDVEKKETGFRKVTYDKNSGILINDKAVWMPGYAQRSTNEWAVIGTATDWLQDYDMSLLKDNNANFIRWMHVAPKPAEVRSSDRYGVAIACPAGDKEGDASGRAWSQRAEAMRDTMIYFRNSPSVIFWETGNSAIAQSHAEDMDRIRNLIDPYGMRFLGARSTQAANQLNYEYNYAGTMYGNYASKAVSAMASNGIYGPIMETEYARDEAPRRVWDDYSPPDYDYVNKWLGSGAKKTDGYDIWDLNQEEITIRNVKEYANDYYSNRAGKGQSLYSAVAMMVWSDSNMHGRNAGTENCRTTGRVDPVRQTKEMFEGTRAAQATESTVHIVGHWSYPEVSEDTYNYFDKTYNGTYWEYDTSKVLKRDPTKKTVYAIGSSDISKVELYRIDGSEETLIGSDAAADSTFVYQFDNVDVTKGDAVIAKAYDARGTLLATDEIKRTYDAVSLRLTPHTAVKTQGDTVVADWRADGSDIAYFDVEVIDANGNTCALNYDKINLTYSGEGVYLGGYNSGMGSGCFQNTAASAGISNYFGGMKDGVSTIGKDYVYAENGTNRIFVKSTRTAGSFTLTASMDGIPGVSSTITSLAVETVGGLTTAMPSRLEVGVSTGGTSTVDPMKPLMKNKKVIDWNSVVVVSEEDNNTYVTVTVNDDELSLSPKSRLGINNMVFGPLVQILDKLKELGAAVEYTYDTSYNNRPTLAVTTGEHTYYYVENENRLYVDTFDEANSELTEDMPTIENNVMICQLNSTLERIPGVSVNTDYTNNVFKITYSAQ